MPQPAIIAVLSTHRHPRLRYVLDQLSDWFGLKWQLFTDPDKYQAAVAVASINYGPLAGTVKALNLPASAFLSGNDSLYSSILVSKVARLTKTPDLNAPADFDCFSVIFSCLSRYEEYQTEVHDNHQRFTAAQSHAFQHDYLQRPVINEVLVELVGRLTAQFPALDLQLPKPTLELTYDVDVPYAYRLRGWRGLASGFRDLLSNNVRRGIHRFRFLAGSRSVSDPYDTYDWLESLHRRHGLKATYFWLLAKERSTYDPNPPPDNQALAALINRVCSTASIGIHPSYYSSDQPELFAEERNKLREITGHNVEHSRQHFLRFSLPDTYRQLLKAGLRHDHSMGYADAIGYRAGTNLSFYWYDLEREEKTWLRIHPFLAMDVSLKKYQNLCYFASQELILKLAEDVRTTGGPITLLWHNSSFASEYGWAGWAKMYEELIAELAKKLS